MEEVRKGSLRVRLNRRNIFLGVYRSKLRSSPGSFNPILYNLEQEIIGTIWKSGTRWTRRSDLSSGSPDSLALSYRPSWWSPSGRSSCGSACSSGHLARNLQTCSPSCMLGAESLDSLSYNSCFNAKRAYVHRMTLSSQYTSRKSCHLLWLMYQTYSLY